MVRCLAFVFAFILVLLEPSHAQNCSAYPNTLTNGTNADATQVMGNFNYVLGCVRDKLTSSRAYYVRTDGNDSNNGLSNTAAGAFLTVQRAIDAVAALDMGVYQVTIQVAAGTYAGGGQLRPYLGLLPPVLVGDETTPTNVFINTTSGASFQNDGNPTWHIRGMRLKTNSSGSCLDALNGGRIYFQKIDFNGVSGANAHMRAFGAGAMIQATGTYTISGSADFHVVATNVAQINVVNAGTVVVSNNPTFGQGFAYASGVSQIYTSGVTFSGSATGTRYVAQLNAVIYTGGGGPSYFPGSIAGVVTTGGQYQ